MKRACGMLLPVASLPSEYGIGAFSKRLMPLWTSWLRRAAVLADFAAWSYRLWGFSVSGVQCVCGKSVFYRSGNADREGTLTKAECDAADLGENPQDIDYAKQYFHRFPLLKRHLEYGKTSSREKGAVRKSCRNFLRMRSRRIPGNTAFTWRSRITLTGRAFFCGTKRSAPESRMR